MGHSIAHFMWGYQSHFRIGHELHAKSLFRALGDLFCPIYRDLPIEKALPKKRPMP
jgi:hypothetical protein